jgi:hypothetical protein
MNGVGEVTEGYDPEWRPEIPEADAVSYPPSGISRVPDGMPPEKWAMMNRAQRRAHGRKGGRQ